MKKEYTFKLRGIKCLCGNDNLFLDKSLNGYGNILYVCRCTKCGEILYYPNKAMVTVIKEHLREVRRNEDNY